MSGQCWDLVGSRTTPLKEVVSLGNQRSGTMSGTENRHGFLHEQTHKNESD